MQAYFDFLTQRARSEGASAYHRGEPRHAPQRFGTYSGAWIEGWDNASFEVSDAMQAVAA